MADAAVGDAGATAGAGAGAAGAGPVGAGAGAGVGAASAGASGAGAGGGAASAGTGAAGAGTFGTDPGARAAVADAGAGVEASRAGAAYAAAVTAAWDAEYAAGRYVGEPPVRFVRDILAAAREAAATTGLYVGCGNGRNYLPLAQAGLDLAGLDISAVALAQLSTRLDGGAGSRPGGRPGDGPGSRPGRLVCGDLSCLRASALFPLVVGIQVFQHGDRATARAHIRQAARHVAPGGLLCLRVNAAGTDVWPAHEVTERHADGGFTVRYLAGAKRGLLIHFFAEAELAGLLAAGFVPVRPLRCDRTWRAPPAAGQWSQWEATGGSAAEPDVDLSPGIRLGRARREHRPGVPRVRIQQHA